MTCVSFTVLLFHECYRHGITPVMSLFTLNLHNPTPNRIHTWICTSAGYIQQKNAVTQNAKSINFLLCNSRWLQHHYQGTKQVSFILSVVYTPLALSEMLECCEYVTRYWLPNLLSSQPCRRETSQWWTMAAQSMKNQLESTKLLMPSHIGCWRDQITSA